MRTRRNRTRYLVEAALACTVLILAGPARGQNAPNIHPSAPRVQAGIVTAVRQVNAYPYALGADQDTWGKISCDAGADQVPIMQTTTIFRIETGSHFYDLSKVCGMDGDFRKPRFYNANDYTNYDTWKRYEQLKIGDRVKMVFKKTSVQLTIRKCQKLGLLTRQQAKIAYRYPLPFGPTGQKANTVYWSHCVYAVPIMDVRIKWSTTEVAGPGAHGTDSHTQTWDFRVVGSGPISAANSTQIGLGYSASLPPPW